MQDNTQNTSVTSDVGPQQPNAAKPTQDKGSRGKRRQAAVQWLTRFSALHATPVPFDRQGSQQQALASALLDAGKQGLSGRDMVVAVAGVSRHNLVRFAADKCMADDADLSKALTDSQRKSLSSAFWTPGKGDTLQTALDKASAYLAGYLVRSWYGRQGYGAQTTDTRPSATVRYRLTVLPGAKGDLAKGLQRQS